MLIRQGKFAEAAAALQEARTAAAYAHAHHWVMPGPLHQVMLLRTAAAYYLTLAQHGEHTLSAAKALKAAWLQKIRDSLDLARAANLKDQVRKIEQILSTVS